MNVLERGASYSSFATLDNIYSLMVLASLMYFAVIGWTVVSYSRLERSLWESNVCMSRFLVREKRVCRLCFCLDVCLFDCMIVCGHVFVHSYSGVRTEGRSKNSYQSM